MALENQPEVRRHFLIVENDMNDAMLIKRAFSTVSDTVSSFVCRNASEARAYLVGAGMYSNRAAYPLPDAIISDLRMGAETGFDLVQWVRTEESLKAIPMVILSGSGSAAEMERAEKLGISGVYQKPNRLEDLRLLVQRLARELRAERKSTTSPQGNQPPR